MAPESNKLHAIVHGRVQGVYFRYSTRTAALEIGVTGWVRNLPDGTVEVAAIGTPEQLGKLLTFLRKGPPGALVTNIDLTWSNTTGAFNGFRIRH